MPMVMNPANEAFRNPDTEKLAGDGSGRTGVGTTAVVSGISARA